MHQSKSVLIFGGSGFIGTHLCLKLRDQYKVYATYSKKPARIPGVTFFPASIENKDWIKRIMFTINPDIVIYAIGSNSFEWAETNPDLADRYHAVGPAVVAGAADIIQPRFIYLSNPYVFDGVRGNYHENDIVLPPNNIGKVKLGGENVVRSKCLNHIILRSSPVIGRGNGVNLSIIDSLRMVLDRNERIEFSTHTLHSFAPVSGLCEAVQRLIESGFRNRIVHYGGLTKVTYFELAKAFATRFKYNPNLIVPKKAAATKNIASEDSLFDFSLNSTQAVETLKIKPFLLEECFDLIEKELISHL